jgi:ectoine hydroxylase-related dioxygenase (phytanoyl-CoA dioxygenase family)
MKNLESLKREFKEKGYIHISSFFSKQEIADLIQEIVATSSENPSQDILNLGELTFNSRIMHKSQKLREFISQPKVVELLAAFIGPDFWVRWDQAVEKGPGAGTFPWHQDNSYSYLKDPHFQFWVSLTKMSKENGGLWVVPGSHKKILPHGNIGCHKVYQGETSNEEFISAEIGDIVVFSSFTLHSTTPNVTNESRWAYVVEYMHMDHIDPYIESPHLIIAKNGKPHLEYVDKLDSESFLVNRIKYFDLMKTLRSIKKAVLN